MHCIPKSNASLENVIFKFLMVRISRRYDYHYQYYVNHATVIRKSLSRAGNSSKYAILTWILNQDVSPHNAFHRIVTCITQFTDISRPRKVRTIIIFNYR